MSTLFRCLKEDRILVNMKARKKAGAIRELASVLEGEPEISDFRGFLSALFQKESRFRSAVGKGVAIPHYRDENVHHPVVALGFSKDGIDWGGDDPVYILILIGWPDKRDQAYLETVAQIARLFHQESVRQSLLEACTSGEMLKILKGKGTQKDRVVC